jgi:hypothetical protein
METNVQIKLPYFINVTVTVARFSRRLPPSVAWQTNGDHMPYLRLTSAFTEQDKQTADSAYIRRTAVANFVVDKGNRY